MKRIFLLLGLIIFLLVGCSKDDTPKRTKQPVISTVYEVVSLQQEQSFYLNSAFHIGNSRHREIVPIDVPENAVRLYYTASVVEGRKPVKNIKLATQLASYLIDQTGTLGAVLSKITLPEGGTGSADLFIRPNKCTII